MNTDIETIAIVCSSIEIGKDGIGDYSRKLASCFISKYQVILVGIHDFGVESFIQHNLEDGIMLLRYPRSISWNAKTDDLSIRLKQWSIKWISFQFNVFGFDSKGLIYKSLFPLIKLLKPYPIHLVMHELWIGEHQDAPLKHRYWGKIMKVLIYVFLKKVQPKAILVSCEINKFHLSKLGFHSSVIPVFSNIPFVKVSETEKSIRFETTFPELKHIQFNTLVIGMFGIIHPNWNVQKSISQAIKLSHTYNKKLAFLFIGNVANEAIESIKNELVGQEVYFFSTGLIEAESVSQYLSLCNYAFSSNTSIMMGKSGTVAAFLQHGVPVVIDPEFGNVSGFEVKTYHSSLIIELNKWEQHYNSNFLNNCIEKFETIPADIAMVIDNSMNIGIN
jgi:hypothetical protein